MSQEDMTAILLPSARVDFFTTDDGTRGMAEKLKDDWRFARVGMEVRAGGLDAAMEHYAQSPSPELIVIETDDIGADFIERLGGLAGVCAEGTDAVIIGPTNDVHLYRSLVGMGVRDYLVRPVSERDLVGVVAGALVEKRGIAGARLVTVLGGKGGVGATTIAQLIAWNISERLGQKTLLMDAAGSNGTLGVSFGIEPTTGFAEAVRLGAEGTDDDIRRIMQKSTDNLTLFVCGGEPVLSARPDPDSVEVLVNRILRTYPVVVMDMSGASRAVQKRMIALSAQVVVVTTPMLSSLRNTRTYLNETKTIRASLQDVDLVVNMQGMAGGAEVPAKDIEMALGIAPSAKVPYAAKIFAESETSGRPPGDAGAHDILSALMGVAARGAGVTPGKAAAAAGAKTGIFKSLKKAIKGQ